MLQGEEKKVGALYSAVSGLSAIISRSYSRFLYLAPLTPHPSPLTPHASHLTPHPSHLTPSPTDLTGAFGMLVHWPEDPQEKLLVFRMECGGPSKRETIHQLARLLAEAHFSTNAVRKLSRRTIFYGALNARILCVD